MRILKFFGKCILTLIALTIIFWIIVLGTLQTKRGQEWAFNQLVTLLEENTQAKVRIGKVNFSFPLTLYFEDISISQENHPILTIQELELCCAYSNLLQGRLVFSKLRASNIDIHQLFNATATNAPFEKLPTSWNTPVIPFYVKLENVDIRNIHLDDEIINAFSLPNDLSQMFKNSSLNLQGMLSNNPFRKSVTAHLLITTKSENSDIAPFSLGIDTQNHQLSFSLHCNHLSLGMIQANLPPTIKAHLALYVSAPIYAWRNLMQNSLQEDSAIEGHFKLSLQAEEKDQNFLSTLIEQHTFVRGQYLLKSKSEIEIFDLKIENPSFFLEGEALLTSSQEIHHGNFKGEIRNLERFQSWLGQEIKGNFAFEGHASGFIHSPSLILHLESPHLLLSQQFFQNVNSTLQTTSKNNGWGGFLTLSFNHQNIPWKLTTSFDWLENNRITLYRLQADAMRSRLEGEMTCCAPDYIWEGLLEVQTTNLNDISHFLATPLSGDAQLTLQLATVFDANHQKRQGFHAKLMGKTLRYMDWQAQQLTLNLHLDPLLEGEKFFHIFSHLEGERVSWNDISIGHCIADTTHQIDLAQQNLSQLSTKWSAQQIQWPMGQAALATGQADLQNPLQGVQGTIQIAFQDILTPTIHLEQLVGTSTLHPNQTLWPYQINAKGIWKEEIHLIGVGNWHYQPNKFEVQMNDLNGRFGPYPLQLMQPVQFLHHGDGMQLSGLHLKLGEAEIEAEYKQDNQNLFSQFKTNPIPSELFHYIAPELPLAGRATFQGFLEGPLQKPEGRFEIDLHRIQIIEEIFAQKPFIEGKLHLNLNERGLQVKSDLNGIGNTPLRISGILPFKLSLNPFDFKIDSQLPFDVTLNAEGELDPYLHLFYNDTTNLTGQAKIALKLNGQIHEPQIQGKIDLINGTYESLSTGGLYHNIQAHLEGDGSKVRLTKFSAEDHKNGSITATGNMTFDASLHFPFEFQIHPSHIFILDSDYASISASGPLSLIGNAKQSSLQGELTVDQAIIHLEEALPRQVKTVDVRYVNVPEGERPPMYLEQKETNSTLGLNVKLRAPENVMIQGNHLKSEWKGSIDVTGTPENPQLHGDLRITQGEYDFNGKVFNLGQGNIHFAGAADKKTTLYIVASKDIDRIVAEIIVKGPANKPVISFRSNPPLSQREVLSYILFNRGISDITADQGDQLSQSFISLNSNEQTKSSDDFLSRLRNNIGIDRLDFTTNDNENKDIGLQVGKNITENISVSVNQSMASVTPIIAVEAKLHKNLKAQAEAGVNEDAPVRMSIKWKKDY